ncbi:LAME_0D07910g1_1 [Lachancea meyersii CBS 8951]|uniref:LAME_0D07910g1_1 n=1 Tax=Lachancea meyersii CBS 8951 TaxID=1266667 RepID=A0A1G4JAN7_9SACH|nr:LAME_0D07910g1_1 [Lachancea meyersii CBS 8951]
MQSVWVPDPERVFVRAELVEEKTLRNKQNKDEHWAVVKVDGGQVEVPIEEVCEVNPNTFDRIDDMSELTHLNEPSVLYNLENRYADDTIYTYSGLFLVAINPYSNIRIYSQDYINLYHGSPKEDNKPHIFAIAEQAYQNLLSLKRDQSILVTGESGAGKTENTKKILQYLASITSEDKLAPDTTHESFERKILQSNPILEAFGNAQTVRNNNSSRFGKFIKIEFDELGKINGAHVDWYLLEKSRVIQQGPRERNYHIFYQMLSGLSAQDLRKFGLETNSIRGYRYLRDSNASIPGVDDTQDFHALLNSFKVVGFTECEVHTVLTVIAIILHIGNIDFVSERAEQASFSNSVETLCQLLGVTESDFKTAILKPKAKAGKDWVVQSKNAQQARFILNSLSRSLYENLFSHVVQKINDNLDHGSMTENYIGLLDIAGFEIFKHNSFEQLCINYTNEKLQQFFNHHMFVLEQNEYLKENVQWSYIDYGKDLQSTIDLIERKDENPGVLPLLDEESILPKSTDDSFYSKLVSFCSDKSAKFKRSKKDRCFVLTHYAGDVEYNVEGWLSKNKDPLSANLLQLLSTSSNDLIKRFFDSNDSQPNAFKTSSHRHRSQLNSLLDRLSSTEPHFVRCIIPNDKKKAHDFNRKLILDQLRCNGVLEGIRIAREGYPNRIFFKEFFQRYKILSDEYRYSNNSKKNCEIVLSSLHLDPALFKVGNSKLFFKAGVLAGLETKKEDRIASMVSKLIAKINGTIVRRQTSDQLKKLQAAQVLKVAFTTYDKLMKDRWFSLYVKIKPLLDSTQEISKTKKIAEHVKQLEAELERVNLLNRTISTDKSALTEDLTRVREILLVERNKLKEHEDKLELLNSKEKELNDLLEESEKQRQHLTDEKSTLQKTFEKSQGDMQSAEDGAAKAQALLLKLQKENEALNDSIAKLQSELNGAKIACSQLESEKHKLSEELGAMEKELSSKKNSIAELETKLSHSDIELERALQGLEKKFHSTSKRLTSLVEENKYLRDSLERSKKESVEVQNTLQSKEKELQRFLERLEQNQVLIQSLNKERDDLLSEHVSLISGAKALQAELLEYKKKNQALEQTCKALRDTANSSSETALSKVPQNEQTTKRIESLSEQLAREKSLTKFLNERLIDNASSRTSSRSTNDQEDSRLMSGEDIFEAYDELKIELREASFRLEKEVNQKKDLISKLRFTETRLASASFEIQNMSSQLRALKSAIVNAGLHVNLEEILSQVEPVELNHEKLILEIAHLRSQLQAEKQARSDAENAASALHSKIRQIQRSDSSSDIFRLKYEASEQRVKSLESKITSQALRDKTNLTNGEIFIQRGSISKYEEDLKLYKLEKYKLQDLLVESEKQINNLKKGLRQYQTDKAALAEELARLKKELDVSERQNRLLSTSSNNHKVQYENCIEDLHATEGQLKEMIHCLRESEADIKIMASIVERLKAQNKQKDKQLWEVESRNNELESEVEEKNIDISKLQSRVHILNQDLAHFKDRVRTAGDQRQLLAEIENLKAELNSSLRAETELKKENSSTSYTLENVKIEYDSKVEDLLRQNSHYEQVIGGLVDERDAATSVRDELQSSLTKLQGKLGSLNESVTSLLEVKRQLESQRDGLNDKCDESRAALEKLAEEKEMITSKIHSLEEALHLQQQQTERNESLVEQLQSSLTDNKSQLAIEKDKNIVLREENLSLGKSNDQLRSTLGVLESKIADKTEQEAWISKVQELEDLVTQESDAKFEEIKKNKALQRIVEELKGINKKQADTIATANTNREDYVREIAEKLERLEVLENHVAKQEVDGRRIERDRAYQEEQVLYLQKELDLWKEKYNDLSMRRKSIDARSNDELFI